MELRRLYTEQINQFPTDGGTDKCVPYGWGAKKHLTKILSLKIMTSN